MVLVLISEFMQDEIYLSEETKHYTEIDKIIYFSVKGHKYNNKRLKMTGNMIMGEQDIFYRNSYERIKYLSKGLISKSGRSELINIIKSGKLTPASIKRLFLFTAKAEMLREHLARRLSELNIYEGEDIVFYSYRFGIGLFAAIALKSVYKNAKIISRCHGQDFFEFRNKENYLPYRKELYEGVDNLYCISNDGREYVQNRYPQHAEKVGINYLGVRGIDFNKNVTNRPFTLVTCSRIVPIKRLNLLIEALNNISDRDINWIHFGNGSDEYAELIEKKATALGNNINVIFKGFVDNLEVRNFYSNDNPSVFVNLSESEGLPVSIMEACAAGIPIIATDVGGTKEIVKNGYNGYLLDSDFSIEELVKYIYMMMDMETSDFIRLAANSRKIWEENFNSEKNYNDFVSAIIKR